MGGPVLGAVTAIILDRRLREGRRLRSFGRPAYFFMQGEAIGVTGE